MKLGAILLSIILAACSIEPSPAPSAVSSVDTVSIVEIAENFDPPEIVYQTETQVPRSELRRSVSVTKRVALIMANFDSSEPISVTDVYELVAEPVTGYFAEMSHGETTLTTEVFGWYTINSDRSSCRWASWLSEAKQVAAADGVNLSGFTNVFLYVPKQTVCRYAGVAYVGGSSGMLNGTHTWNTFAHELGHNFGLSHAKAARCRQLIDGCTIVEYGDPFDRMGGGTRVHFNAQYKSRLGYIPLGSQVTVTRDRGLTLLPAARQAPRRVAFIDRGDGTRLVLEYRREFGLYERFVSSDPSRGLLIRILGTDRRTILLDMHPETVTFTDAMLLPGEVWRDSLSRVRIRVMRITDTGIRIRTNLP